MDSGACVRIAELALEGIGPQTRLLEIGAGTGALTDALIALGAMPTVLELDEALVGILRERETLAAATILHADALEFDYASFARVGTWRAVGNLPYNIATPIVTNLVEMQSGPEELVVMVQRDVAARFAARAGTPEYGSLSVAVQFSMHVEPAFSLPPDAFHPRPNVHSTVVRLRRREQPAAVVADLPLFRQVVRAAFAYRRKTLLNSLMLALELPRELLASAIAASGLDAQSRGEQLDIAAFARLADAVAKGRV